MLASSFMPLLVGIGWLSLMLLTGVVLRAKVGFLQKYLFPASLIGGVLGFIVINVDWTTVLYLGRRTGAEAYSFERMLAIFGTMTGTVASGLLLLRIVDPDFESPVVTELGLCGMMGLFLGLHIAFFSYPQPEIGIKKWLMVVAITAVVMLVLLKVFKFWKKKAW
ncbi:MAG: hypothetical protein HOK67_19285 [Deltaproteobacteria bacterium]|jgi:glutamate:Na+ symporter, ESS family|nr:hypothetical protein [Deltaproteobacteria bacterium]MBT7152220.1 hypothetical protein [Deltaproteobacteria bacterium]